MKRYPGTGLFRSKRRYMQAQRELYPNEPFRSYRTPAGRKLRAFSHIESVDRYDRGIYRESL